MNLSIFNGGMKSIDYDCMNKSIFIASIKIIMIKKHYNKYYNDGAAVGAACNGVFFLFYFRDFFSVVFKSFLSYLNQTKEGGELI